jgi:hypothetical protein
MNMSDEGAFDWVNEIDTEESHVENLVEATKPQIKTAKDFLKRKIEVRKQTNDSPDYTRGYRDGFFDCETKMKKKWFDMGYNKALSETKLDD